MPVSIDDFLSSFAARNNLGRKRSELTLSSLYALDSALWLVAGRRYSQALVTAHNAVELGLKGELESIHRILVANTSKLNYSDLKALVRDSFLNHPMGKQIAIQDFSIENSINFRDSVDRVLEMYPELRNWKLRLDELNKVRNDCVHYGPHRRDSSEYVRLLVCDAVPFLRSFFEKSIDLDLSELHGEVVSRELRVAADACSLSQKTGGSCATASKTLEAAILYGRVDNREPFDAEGRGIDTFDVLQAASEGVQATLRSLGSGWLVRVGCKLCGSWHAFAGVGEIDVDKEPSDVNPIAIGCANCGLEIAPSDGPLAEVHFGMVTAEDVRKSIDETYGP